MFRISKQDVTISLYGGDDSATLAGSIGNGHTSSCMELRSKGLKLDDPPGFCDPGTSNPDEFAPDSFRKSKPSGS